MSDLTRTGGLTSRHEPGAIAHRCADDASDLLKRLFRSFDGSLALRLWNGITLRLGSAAPHASDPSFTLVCHHPGRRSFDGARARSPSSGRSLFPG